VYRYSVIIGDKWQKKQVGLDGFPAIRLKEARGAIANSDSVYDKAEIEYNQAVLALDTAKLERTIARTEYKRSQMQLDRRIIKSPVNGVVINVGMAPGEYVHDAETDPLHVEVYTPVASYGQITEGMQAVVRLEQPIGGEHRVTVNVVDHVFDAASRTFDVRMELPNPQFGLPAGVRCTVGFETAAQGDEK